jgi:hypothetical protein
MPCAPTGSNRKRRIRRRISVMALTKLGYGIKLLRLSTEEKYM